MARGFQSASDLPLRGIRTSTYSIFANKNLVEVSDNPQEEKGLHATRLLERLRYDITQRYNSKDSQQHDYKIKLRISPQATTPNPPNDRPVANSYVYIEAPTILHPNDSHSLPSVQMNLLAYSSTMQD